MEMNGDLFSFLVRLEVKKRKKGNQINIYFYHYAHYILFVFERNGGGGGIHDFSSINEGNRSFHPILGNEHIREWNGHSLIVSPLLPTKF